MNCARSENGKVVIIVIKISKTSGMTEEPELAVLPSDQIENHVCFIILSRTFFLRKELMKMLWELPFTSGKDWLK